MLSRVADAIYWMSRYLERAENIARFLDVNWHLALDAPDHAGAQWEPLVSITGELDQFRIRYDTASQENVIRFLALDEEYSSSILACLRKARENARTVREMLPSEMWEYVNVFYHYVENAAKNPGRLLENPYALCEEVKSRHLLLSGIAGETMTHDEAWDFFVLGRLLERADKTSRILDVKYFILLPCMEQVCSAFDDIQWAALLKGTSGLQAYRHRFGRILPSQVVEFLLLDHDFPRSVLYCLTEAQHRLHSITGTRIGHFTNPAEKDLGVLCAELSYHSIEEIISQGLHEFIDSLQVRMNQVGEAIFTTFFATFPAIDGQVEQ